MPADDTCASAAPTNTIRRSTTYTPRTAQVTAMMSEPYSASRNRSTASSMPVLFGLLTFGEHDAMPFERAHLDRNPVHVAQGLLRHDLFDGSDRSEERRVGKGCRSRWT